MWVSASDFRVQQTMEGPFGGAAAVENLWPGSLEEVAFHGVQVLPHGAGQSHVIFFGVAVHRLHVEIYKYAVKSSEKIIFYE